jgi:two-component system, chemotaxis family, response regulator Rcp1
MEANGRKIQIFVVEDNPGDIQLLRMALDTADLDYALTVVSDGREALDFVQQRGKYAHTSPPDLAILDLNLPKNDGLEILAAMRANGAFQEVPVAVLSSSSSPRDRAGVERFGIGRFIAKPPDLDEYLKIGLMIKELLAEKHSGRN